MGSFFLILKKGTLIPEQRTGSAQRAFILCGVGPRTEILPQHMGIETFTDLFAHYPLHPITYPGLMEVGVLGADDADMPVTVYAESVWKLM